MIVPAVGLDLDMLANHIEAQLLGHLDIIEHGLVGGCGVKAIGEPSLVQWPILEIILAVELHTDNAVLVACRGDGTHGGIGGGFVDDLAVAIEPHPDIVEIGRFGRPKFGIGNGNTQFAASNAFGCAYLSRTVEECDLDKIVVAVACGIDGD